MEKLYFTFGSDKNFPFGIDDYVVIYGLSVKDCTNTFRERYPNRPGSDCLNCADYYKRHEWDRVKKYYKGTQPAKVLVSASLYGCRPEGFRPLWLVLPETKEILYMEGAKTNDGGTCISYTLFEMMRRHADKGQQCDIDRELDGSMVIEPDKYDCMVDVVPDLLSEVYNEYRAARIISVEKLSI